ncbi:hypothetical protein ACJX0J_022668, partial [Zea mays]
NIDAAGFFGDFIALDSNLISVFAQQILRLILFRLPRLIIVNGGDNGKGPAIAATVGVACTQAQFPGECRKGNIHFIFCNLFSIVTRLVLHNKMEVPVKVVLTA